MSNPRIMVTIPGPLLAFLDHEKRTMGRGYSDTLRSLALNSREFAEYRKTKPAKPSTLPETITTVVSPVPVEPPAHPGVCPHGAKREGAWDDEFCYLCAVETGDANVCHKHQEMTPCYECAVATGEVENEP